MFSRRINPIYVGVLLFFVIAPYTILCGVYFLGDRKYYFISLLLIVYAMIPFILKFEQRKAKARELIVIAVLISIAVAGRAAFFMLPQFKPVVAIVIISAVCLGAEAGLIIGMMTGFVSNFFYGQGPWTPWQMLSFGLIGYIAGLIFAKRKARKSLLLLCIFGAFATFIVYGGIMNFASLTMFMPSFSWQALLATYVTGFWFDMVHTFATVCFLVLLAKPMIEKLERLKTKYGLLL